MNGKPKINIGAIITEPGSSVKNKTGSWRSLRPVVDTSKCIKCGKCWQCCPDNTINPRKKDGKSEVDYNYCKGCGICASVCPVKCIAMQKEQKQLENWD